MQIEFYKYQGTGNDFILFDNRHKVLRSDMETFYSLICDRRFGIGADGVILLQDAAGYDFEMVYMNADGRPGTFCGNGSRCIIRFAQSLGIEKAQYRFLAADGPHEAFIEGDIIRIKMRDVESVEQFLNFYELDTGSPHYVEFVNKVESIDVKKEGSKIRYSEKYGGGGINVNFVEVNEPGISMRTYERGVEGETLSCGTGVVAAAIVFSIDHKFIAGNHTIPVQVPGGELSVSYEKVNDNHFENIWLSGPAKFVFSGSVNI